MAQFTFKARISSGELVVGEVESENAQSVADHLINEGKIPIDIKEKIETKSWWMISGTQKSKQEKLSSDELILLSRQFYTLTKAGVPILQALDGLKNSTDNKRIRNIIGDLAKSLNEGTDFTTALARQPKVFSSIFVNLVRVGENTGNMTEVFFELSNFLSKDRDTQKKVVSALRYPIIVLVFILGALISMNVFVIPKFAALYQSFGAALPLPTRIIISVSSFITSYGYLLALVAVFLLETFRRYIKTRTGRYQWDSLKLRLPVVGKLVKMAAITKFARTMAITVKSGLPIVQGLHVIGPAVGNAYIEERIKKIQDGVERGDTIANAATRLNIFPPTVTQMIAVGEQSGSLDDMTKEVAEYYERELDYIIQNLSAAIEPILIIAISGMVLIMALGIFLPMWDMMDAIRK